MPHNKTFENNLRINGIDEKVIKIIMGELYRSTVILTMQDAVNFFVDAMEKAEK
ncbi:MAG: hypothetical protein JW881_16420 [Spirochaetales bacterium]|nr:hypothetical protein [Spirochaetales bacterium]